MNVDSQPGAVVVCLDYVPPSVRHVPWLLEVLDRPALSLLLERLASFFARCDAWVVSADAARQAVAGQVAASQGFDLFETGDRSLPSVLGAFCQGRQPPEDLLVFPGASIVPDCVQSLAMLASHRQGKAEATFAADGFLDGLLPLVLSAGGAAKLWPACQGCSDWKGILEFLRSPDSDRLIRKLAYRLPPQADPEGERMLPAFGVMRDRWTSKAAAAAIQRHSGLFGPEAAQAFKQTLIATLSEVPKVTARGFSGGGSRARILFSSLRTAFSGGEQSLFSLISNFDPSKCSPAVLFAFDSLLRAKLDDKGIPTLVAGWDYSEITARNLDFCYAVLDSLRPDIVHVDALPNPSLMAAAHARGIPIIGHLRIIPQDSISSFAYMPAAIITVSNVVASRLKRFNIRPDSIVVIHNGVAGCETSPSQRAALRRRLDIPQGAFVFLVVSRITPSKRVEMFLQAFDQVAGQAPDSWALVVGEPSARFGPYAKDDVGYAERLREQARQMGAAERVRWLGFQSDIESVYSASDSLVTASVDEPFPRCVLEALSAGLAVIGPDAGGAVEAIEAGKSGLLFEANSTASLAAAMLSVAQDEARYRTLSANARLRARHFSVERHARRVEALYERFLDRKALDRS